jgi:hypothetical protein
LALRALRALADVLAPRDRVAVIAVGPTPQVLLQSGDVATLRRLLTDVGNEGRFPWTAARIGTRRARWPPAWPPART